MAQTQIRLFMAILAFFLFSVRAFSEERFWISFGSGENGPNELYLTQIDILGSVKREAQIVIPSDGLGSFSYTMVSAIDNGSNSDTLNIWTAFDPPGGDSLFLTRVSKSDLKIVKVFDLGISVTNYLSVQATQNAAQRFVAASVDSDGTAIYVKSNGLPAATMRNISPATDGLTAFIGLSADGGMVAGRRFGAAGVELHLQPLNSKGKPRAAAKLLNNEDVGSVDISNVLPGNIRFVVYSVEETVYLQRVDASTGQKIGVAKTIYSGNSYLLAQKLAIEPLGRFVVLPDDGPATCDEKLIVIHLDATGSASGTPTAIVDSSINGCSIGGLDILREIF